MNFVEELRWRGMLHDITPGAEAFLSDKMVTGYIGFDPTAPSLTIGNYVPIMLLNLFQKAGHKPIFLLGGATGSVGDPSGKDQERQLKTFEELETNLEFQQKQARRLLNFESGDNKAIFVNNIDFYKEMNVLDFLRDVGKHLTVNYMLSKEAVKRRLETGVSYTEFSYQLLQAYDFYCLYKKYDCRLQMGGSDQWGNITSGTEYIRRCIPESKAFALTSPLLTKLDGKKFGKSEEGNIWLDPKLTSPYKFYQYWINASDADLPTYMRYFSFSSKEEVNALENQYKEDPRSLKKIFAEEITKRIHSEEDYTSVLLVSEILFNRNASRESLLSLRKNELEIIAEEIPSFEIDKGLIQDHVNIVELIAEHTEIVKSKGEARRSIQNNALSVNKQKISSHENSIKSEELLCGEFLMIENGKKNKYIIKAS